MNRILELQLMQIDAASMNDTNETNYSTCSNRRARPPMGMASTRWLDEPGGRGAGGLMAPVPASA
ncbi:hypothetical protein ACQKIE_08195 [Luteibacter sp. NPDC031894]|uniref:hypothetical protein n=1 Tax=Luteibacter sp. NPDC031894 TaxID=3390572 RepID=UPI003D071FD1